MALLLVDDAREFHTRMKPACVFVWLMWWNGVCVCVCDESKACKGPLSPLPSTPIPDGVSLGPLMNIDAWGHG